LVRVTMPVGQSDNASCPVCPFAELDRRVILLAVPGKEGNGPAMARSQTESVAGSQHRGDIPLRPWLPRTTTVQASHYG